MMAPVYPPVSPVIGRWSRTYTEEAVGVGTGHSPGGSLSSRHPGGLSSSLWASFRGCDETRPAQLTGRAGTRETARGCAVVHSNAATCAQRASHWGLSGVRSAWPPGDSALRSLQAQLHTPGVPAASVTRPARPPAGAEGLEEYGGGRGSGRQCPR